MTAPSTIVRESVSAARLPGPPATSSGVLAAVPHVRSWVCSVKPGSPSNSCMNARSAIQYWYYSTIRVGALRVGGLFMRANVLGHVNGVRASDYVAEEGAKELSAFTAEMRR